MFFKSFCYELNLYLKLLMELYNVAKFMYLTELFPSWAFSIFILAICMFLSNTRLKLVRLLVRVASVSNVEETVQCVYQVVLNFVFLKLHVFASRF